MMTHAMDINQSYNIQSQAVLACKAREQLARPMDVIWNNDLRLLIPDA
jgi:hypothetical protein